jgi:hypothetical protein
MSSKERMRKKIDDMTLKKTKIEKKEYSGPQFILEGIQ